MPILVTLASVVDSFALPGGIEVERRTSTIVDGYQVDDTLAILQVSPVVVHRASGRDLLLLPEGDRTKETIQVLTRDRLRTALDGSAEQADVIRYTPGGEGVQRRYLVITAEDWYAQSGHYRHLAVRISDS